jgi:tetratricopeptide (TPR) repeat protein
MRNTSTGVLRGLEQRGGYAVTIRNLPSTMHFEVPMYRLLLVFLIGCGGGRPVVSEVVSIEEMRIVASRGDDGSLVLDGYDAARLFERGARELNERRCQRAVEHYDRLVLEFPTSRYVGPALYNAGLCLQEAGEDEAAVPYYRRLIARNAASRDAKHASLQLAQVYVDLERWEDGLALVERLLLRDDLETIERLEGLARRSQMLLGLERLDEAERQARDALSYYRTRRGDEEIADPYFAAAANYVLAETIRRRSERMTVPAASALEQHRVLDERAALLLSAQREYFNTIHFTEAHWSAAAGDRISAMYDHLWQAMMQAPIAPPSRELTPASVPIYEQQYRSELARHIRPLLRHAIRYWELTLSWVERNGSASGWAERARSDLERMRELLSDQSQPETPGA